MRPTQGLPSATRRLILPLALVLLAFAAAPAHATLRVSSNSTDGLIVEDKNDLGDFLTIIGGTSQGDSVYRIINANPIDFFKFEFGQACSQGSDGSEAVCNRLRTKLNLAMVGGDDNVDVDQSDATLTSVNLGLGSDTYLGINGSDDVFAAGGNDNVKTFGGNDSIRFVTGQDKVDAGSGNDDIRDGIPSGTHDAGKDEIQDGEGADTVSLSSGVTGPVVVGVGDGNDTITTAGGNDDIVSGSGTITPFTNPGGGVDKITSKGGDDDIVVKESPFITRAADSVNCGFGDDRVEADLTDQVDAISNKGGGTCEEVDRSPVGETPHVRIRAKTLAVSPNGSVDVGLRCPRGVKRLGCSGTLQLRIARARGRGVQAGASRSQKVRYRIRAGRRKTVRLTLTASDVGRIRRRTRGILVSVEKGRIGPKTTVRNPRLRLRRG